MIKAIVFDLDDTLYPEYDYVISGFKAAADYVKKEFGVSDSEKEFAELFEQSRAGVFDRFAAAHRLVEGAAEKLTSVYRDHKPKISLADDVKVTLARLREKGYKLGIITDGRPNGQKKKIDALELEKLTDKILITDELGGVEFRKPHPKAFEIMCKQFGIEPSEMLYVGDNPQKDFAIKNYLPVRTAAVFLYHGLYDGSEYLLDILPDTIIHNISDVIKICGA